MPRGGLCGAIMHTNTHTGESRQSPVPVSPRSASLPGLLARQTVRAPDAPAVQDGGRTYSYQELDDWSRSLSQGLLSRAIRPGDAVAVLGTRSWEATVAIVGILRAGAVCVPVDAQYPSAQAAEMLTDAGARLAIALPGHEPVAAAGDEPVGWEEFDALLRMRPTVDHGPDFPSLTERSAENCAYVLFTSGTTGRPKPVLFPHRAVTRLRKTARPGAPAPEARPADLRPLLRRTCSSRCGPRCWAAAASSWRAGTYSWTRRRWARCSTPSASRMPS